MVTPPQKKKKISVTLITLIQFFCCIISFRKCKVVLKCWENILYHKVIFMIRRINTVWIDGLTAHFLYGLLETKFEIIIT